MRNSRSLAQILPRPRTAAILVVALLAGLIAFLARQSIPPQYAANVTILIQPGHPAFDWARAAQTYAQLARSPAVVRSALDAAHSDLAPDALAAAISVAPVAGTQLVLLSVESSEAAQATQLVWAVARALVTQADKLRANTDSAALTAQIDDLTTQIATARAEGSALTAQIAANHDAGTLADLRAGRNDAILRYLLLEADLARLTTARALANQNLTTIQIVAEASTGAPLTTISPLAAAAIGALVAGALMIGVGWFIENADNSMRSAETIRRTLALTALGTLPVIRNRSGDDKLIHAGGEAYDEAFRALAERLYAERACRVLAITSPLHGDGKSLIAANLAIALAEAGRHTLLIDADLRTPAQHKLFKLNNRDGLTGLLYQLALRPDTEANSQNDGADMLRVLKRTEIDGLTVLTSGPLPPNPSEVIGSVQMLRLVRSLAEQFDVILIDTPPVLTDSDTLMLTPNLENTLLVIDARQTGRRAARRAVRQLRGVDASLVGAALNRARG